MSGRDDKRPVQKPENPEDGKKHQDLENERVEDYEGDGEGDDFDHYSKKSGKRFHRQSNWSKDRWDDED